MLAGGSLRARADEPRTWQPRLTLLEGQYPQGVDVSGGAWFLSRTRETFAPAVLGDLELGLSGAVVDVGVGVANYRVSTEHLLAFGLEGTAMRSWPGWSLALPPNETLVGGRVFASYFALRCSLGALWTVEGARAGRVVPLLGCGIGFL
jgi:hypothetical protein